jgi:hypothetical protein
VPSPVSKNAGVKLWQHLASILTAAKSLSGRNVLWQLEIFDKISSLSASKFAQFGIGDPASSPTNVADKSTNYSSFCVSPLSAVQSRTPEGLRQRSKFPNAHAAPKVRTQIQLEYRPTKRVNLVSNSQTQILKPTFLALGASSNAFTLSHILANPSSLFPSWPHFPLLSPDALLPPLLRPAFLPALSPVSPLPLVSPQPLFPLLFSGLRLSPLLYFFVPFLHLLFPSGVSTPLLFLSLLVSAVPQLAQLPPLVKVLPRPLLQLCNRNSTGSDEPQVRLAAANL